MAKSNLTNHASTGNTIQSTHLLTFSETKGNTSVIVTMMVSRGSYSQFRVLGPVGWSLFDDLDEPHRILTLFAQPCTS